MESVIEARRCTLRQILAVLFATLATVIWLALATKFCYYGDGVSVFGLVAGIACFVITMILQERRGWQPSTAQQDTIILASLTALCSELLVLFLFIPSPVIKWGMWVGRGTSTLTQPFILAVPLLQQMDWVSFTYAAAEVPVRVSPMGATASALQFKMRAETFSLNRSDPSRLERYLLELAVQGAPSDILKGNLASLLQKSAAEEFRQYHLTSIELQFSARLTMALQDGIMRRMLDELPSQMLLWRSGGVEFSQYPKLVRRE